ncbi:Y' element ATP-dependent helicase protein 1 copy 3 [Saccharomyces cerevisiae]
MKVSDRRKFEKANFDEFESALNNKNDLVHCPSITLFESIPTEVRSFYEDEKSGLIKVVKFRTGAMDRKRSFEKIVISVMVGKNVQKFLTFVEDEPDFQGGPIPSKYLIPKKINLMVYTLFQVHTLKFNRKDYDTLSLFYLNRGYYNELSFRVLERCHEIASARPNDSSTMRTFTDFVSGAPILTVIRLPLSRATAQRIRRRYNKNGSSEPRLKTLDGLTSERWIQWLGLESDYHCSFSSTRNAEDVVAGEAASSDHHQKISRVTRKRPREPKSTNDILVAGRKLFGSSFEFRDLHQLRLCHEIYMADTPSVAVQAPPGYGKTELFHLPLIALASKGDVKYVSFLFVPYTVLLANCMIRLSRCGCLNVAPVRNFIEEGCDGVTDLYVGIYDDLASTNFTDRIAAWENIVECTFRTNNVKLGYLIVDEFHNFETEVYRQSQFGGITNLDFDAFEKAIFLSGTAPEAVADAALQRIGLTGLAKKSMDINELKRSEDLSRGLSSYPTRMFNLIKEKSEVPLGHVHKIWKKVESQPEEALKLLLALFEIEPESKAIVVASTTNEVEELACSWRKYFRVVWIHGKLGAAEKVSRTKEFVTDGSMRVLIGTKLVTEGIDIKQLMMVIMLDNRPNIIELIQGVGRLRDGGLCYLLSGKNSWAARNRKGELPPIKEGCITEQVREFYGLESKKGKKGQHVGCCGSRTDLSADTVELIERMDRLAEKQATASMSIVALPSSFQESNSSDRCRKYCSSDEDSDTCIHGSANASTNATTNSSTNATTTASTNVRTSATTTESTNSSTNATTTESTDSNTSATTTASTNSSTNATTTESTNASAKEDANKDGNAEDNRFHPVTDINKEPYKRKGSQMVLLERKKLKAQFPNTSENMNVLQFLGFRSDEIKHLFLYGIDVYFCPEGVFTQYGLCKGCQKMFELCVCWAGQKVSYRRMAWEALAVERMLRNDEEYKEYLEDIEPYHGDPASKGAKFSACLEGRSKSLYYKVWSNLRESKTEVLQYFLNWDEKKCREEWEAKDDTVFVEALEKVGVFQRLRSMTSAGLQGPQYVKLQFSRHHRQLRSRYELSLGMHLRDQLALGVTPSKVPHWTAFLSMLIGLFCNKTFRQKLEYLLEQISEVWLLPHWVDLANVEVLAADNTRVPLYMLMVAVHKELDSDDVPDGRFDIILLCRDSSREVGE